jgi:hypothetical protein
MPLLLVTTNWKVSLTSFMVIGSTNVGFGDTGLFRLMYGPPV